LGQQGFARAGRTDQEDVRFVDFDVRAAGAVHQALVVAGDGHGENFLGVLLTDHVLIELRDDLPGGGDFAEQRLAGSAPPAL